VAEPPEELEGLGIEDAERAYLATAYDSGQSLWRVPIPHLSSVDINLPVKPVSEDAEAPAEEPEAATTGDDPCSKTGSSSIECQNQTLGERVQLAGIPFGLNYRSDRSRGRKDLFRVRIPLGSEPLPTDLLRIDLTVSIAGRTLNRSFTPEPDQEFTFEWDGTDAYGRAVQGSALAQVTVGYVYDGVYVGPQDVDPAFATTDGVPLDVPARLEATLRRTWSVPLGTLSAEGLGLGGWSVAVHHTYDPTRRVLYRGDGSKRQASAMGSVITTAARIGAFGVAVAPDGSYYVAQSTRVSKVSPDGVITPFAGTGVSGYSGDGGPASEAQLNGAYSVALGPDGSLYIADWYNYRVREVTPDGTIWTVAGDGEPGEPGEGDGGPATSASLAGPSFVAVSLDGTLAFADAGRVRMVLPCGEIVSVAGAGGPGSTGDGGPAIDAGFYRLGGVAWSPDGTLYATDALSVRRIGPDGIIDTAVGPEAFLGPDGEQYYPASVAVGPEGSLYVGFQYGHHIRRVAPDGTSTVFACGFEEGFSGDGGPPAAALCAHVAGVAVAPDGAVYVLDSANSRVRRVSAPLPGLGVDELLIAAGDAPEVYRFDSTGRHLETRHALTGATLYDFSYDPAGRLAEIHDGDGNVIRIERDGAGRPTAVVSPSGVRTVLAVDGSGHLERVTNPAGEGVQVVHDPAGLLLSLTNPRGLSVSYTYDGGGRLTAAQGPDGGTKSFHRTAIAGGFEVAELSAAGRQSLYRVEQLATGGTRSINQTGAGRGVLTEMRPDGSAHVTTSDGTTWTIAGGVDPRFGRQSSFAAGLTLQTPGGLVASQTKTVTATSPWLGGRSRRPSTRRPGRFCGRCRAAAAPSSC
jgi:YD repeat-containing protein